MATNFVGEIDFHSTHLTSSRAVHTMSRNLGVRREVQPQTYTIPQTFTVTSELIRFYFFSFSVLHFLVVVSVR